MPNLITALALFLLTLLDPLPARKAMKDVNVDQLTEEGQHSAEPSDGMNLAWFIPIEFWDATLAGDTDIPPADVRAFIESLEGYLIIGLVRADISDEGEFTYHKAAPVLDNLSVVYTPAGGQPTELTHITKKDGDAVHEVVQAMRPMLTQAMGALGRNFHFFVYKDTDEAGKRLVSPYEPGTLTITLSKLSNEDGGVIEVAMPFDSLYESRLCPKCSKKQKLAWKFCPWDGMELAK